MGICKGVVIEVQGVRIVQSFFLLELGGVHVVLGMDWLVSLGKIEVDFQEMYLQWKAQGKEWRIQGDPALCHTQAL